jgi:hypothetical protein
MYYHGNRSRPAFAEERGGYKFPTSAVLRIAVRERHSTDVNGSCPETWCRSWAAGITVAGRAALVHAATAGSMRVRSSRKGAMVSRVM